ncbi:(S)-benzoin forming benzil reductase [Virgibacillus sp. W0430]|uniref:(S)-benzoin forming benzil reductase n=1 Tax=Virgibacillus sp. W0430 TaxID=3391580 RepID=UPI003F44B85B
MKLAIITGGSKGLGEAIAKQFLNENTDVISISRTLNEKLSALAEQKQVNFIHYASDLGDMKELKTVVSHLEGHLSRSELETIYVINNAAALEPIQPASKINVDDLAYHVHVNTIAPMAIMNALLNQCSRENKSVVGVNITSGAANRAVFGWSAYCSTKASLDRYTTTVALEQEEMQTGNKIIAFDPSIMDTDMQKKIRSTSEDAFIDVRAFQAYKTNNMLQDVEVVAGKLYQIIADKARIENGKIYRVNEL